MKVSKLAVKILENDSVVYYDPIYHGRTLKVIGIDDDPVEVMEYLLAQYKEKGYSIVVFDTSGHFPTGLFESVLRIEEGNPAGLDPLKMARMGIIKDPYSAVTIVQTIYELDSASTDKLYADFVTGKVNSIADAVRAKKNYSEVILEGYTDLDEMLFSGDPVRIPESGLIDLSGLNSVTLTGMAFLILAAAMEDKRRVVYGLYDVAVLTFTGAGNAGLPLLTRPARRRVAILGTRYPLDQVLSIPGPTLLLYNDPDVQSAIYESQGVPAGLRAFIDKGEGAYIWRSPETINIEFGKVLKLQS
ncbi:hypothetical protein A3L04_10705 [Thermococcus chitonophagus]|uniref:Uncharacterized protein n=1 Tax=Thermococcus chitonophagus TaxID=54262 RepID=A0A160VU89_9EURY|nr:hypothetical protein [Thermococcus chitonophagus]ASJ17502.1 hypothetical protein A3L04_10705 [Thermococcus chitonophagus]CUX78156.1 hypothetical protein CHITON_1377 [Thermococcus chitonophagus]